MFADEKKLIEKELMSIKKNFNTYETRRRKAKFVSYKKLISEI